MYCDEIVINDAIKYGRVNLEMELICTGDYLVLFGKLYLPVSMTFKLFILDHFVFMLVGTFDELNTTVDYMRAYRLRLHLKMLS